MALIPPALTIDEAVDIIKKINSDCGTRPFKPEILPHIFGVTEKSSFFHQRLATLKKFKLLDKKGNELSISENGKMIVAPMSDDEVIKAKRQAVMNIEPIPDLQKRYSNGVLPGDDFLRNFLTREYDIQSNHLSSWIKFIRSSFKLLKPAYVRNVFDIVKDRQSPHQESLANEEKEPFEYKLTFKAGKVYIHMPVGLTEKDREIIRKTIDAYPYEKNRESEE